MFIRVKIGNNEAVFNNQDRTKRELLYRTHNDKSQDVLTDEHFNDICNLITHMAKELKENYD